MSKIVPGYIPMVMVDQLHTRLSWCWLGYSAASLVSAGSATISLPGSWSSLDAYLDDNSFDPSRLSVLSWSMHWLLPTNLLGKLIAQWACTWLHSFSAIIHEWLGHFSAWFCCSWQEVCCWDSFLICRQLFEPTPSSFPFQNPELWTLGWFFRLVRPVGRLLRGSLSGFGCAASVSLCMPHWHRLLVSLTYPPTSLISQDIEVVCLHSDGWVKLLILALIHHRKSLPPE